MAAAAVAEPVTSPPEPPNPSEDAGLIPRIGSGPVNLSTIPSPPDVTLKWDANDILPETAMKMLCRALQALVAITGDVPPTPPLSRPTTPRGSVDLSASASASSNKENVNTFHKHKRSPSRPATPVPSDDIKAPTFKNVDVGSPEASRDEPATALDAQWIGGDALPTLEQQQAIARKFFSKAPPPVSLEDYLARLQRYCPMSTAVYLAAGVYIHKLSVEDKLVPVTPRTVHRLTLASLRVAMKALEDLRYPQQRFAGVGGVRESELRLLEISLCYLTDFDLQVDNEMLYRKAVGLQQAAVRASVVKSRLDPREMKLKIPMRRKTNFNA